MENRPIVSASEWDDAYQQLLVKEKAMTRARDALAAERRRMPWQAIEKTYHFEGPDGPVTLIDLFEGRRQLLLYRAFMDPGVSGWPEHGCVGCSLMADHVPNLAHLNSRNTTLAFASRAAQPELRRNAERMGWQHIPWYTMLDDFDVDFGVDQYRGTIVFVRDGDQIFKTYFVNGRGDEYNSNTWNYLDLTALGRQEEWEDSPAGYPQTPPHVWWRWHDTYGTDVSQERLEQINRSVQADQAKRDARRT